MSKSKDEQAQELWQNFCNAFDDAVMECIKNGTPWMMTLGSGKGLVTIEVYRDKGQMKQFTDMIQDAHKMQVGKVDA